jgi:UDP-N-acetyl-D-glucosamine dehydrogenase
MTHTETLAARIENRSAQLAVIGLGYVGLPLAVEFARAGFRVVGYDRDAAKIGAIAEGRSYVRDVPDAALAGVVRSGHFRATGDPSVLSKADAIHICVPTPLRKTRDPDVSFIIAAVADIRKTLRVGQLVVLESTTFPGTTEEVILPMLSESGLRAGEDFFLAFSPERVDPGNAAFSTRNIPKVVGGLTPRCTELAAALYCVALDAVVPVSSPRVAEMVKLLENTFRSVNIGLVNEMALLCDRIGINVWEVIDAAATKPFGFMPFYPGPGLGGHCIPVDPFYLAWKARERGFDARFIELAGQINSYMPYYVVSKVTDALNRSRKAVRGSRILLLGVAYKAGTDDVRESPALDLIELLAERGGVLSYHDPFVPRIEVPLALSSAPLTEATLRACDCAVIVAGHAGVDYDLVVRHAPAIVDTRNVLKGRAEEHIVRI